MATRSGFAAPMVPAPDARKVLANVLMARIDRAYMTVGSAGGRRVVQDILGHINAGSLSAAIHELGLDKELDRELTSLDAD